MCYFNRLIDNENIVNKVKKISIKKLFQSSISMVDKLSGTNLFHEKGTSRSNDFLCLQIAQRPRRNDHRVEDAARRARCLSVTTAQRVIDTTESSTSGHCMMAP
jgi:hypothetical protein